MAADRDKQDALLDAYVQRLLAVEGDGQHVLSDDDLRTIAQELGLSDEALARIEQVVEDHLTRGRNFYARGMFQDAADEIHQAAVLRPFSADIATELARAHLGQLRKTGDKKDRDRARRSARRAIAIDADHKPAFEVLHACETTSNQKSSAYLVPVIIVVAVIACVGVALVMDQFDNERSSAAAQQSQTSVTPSSLSSATPPPTVTDTRPERTEIDVPLELTGENVDGLTLTVQKARLRRHSGAFSFTLDATVTVAERELQHLRTRLELLAPGGAVVREKAHEIHSTHRPNLRPGESTPVHVLLFEKQNAPEIASARLVVEVRDDMPAAADYGQDSEVPLSWPGQRPAYIDLVVRERKSEIKDLFGKVSHWLTLTLENRGTRPIQGLTLEVVAKDGEGDVLGRKKSLVVSSANAALPAGQTWVYRSINELGAGVGERMSGYELRVLNAD